jgi:4-amino-4-deoxy-L-arabinose transferase-like glycosyltransferase
VRRHAHRLALGAVILIALAVRLHDLDGESIWADEAFSIAMARHSVAEIAARTAAEDTTPPLYYFVLHAWGSIFGDSPAAARMPSVVTGVLAVVFVYLAGVPLIGRPAALVAALLHALSPFLVAYSQEARQYSLLSCASAASFAALIRLLRGHRWAIPAYMAAAILTLYSHSVGVFVLLAQMVFVAGLPVIAPTERWRRALVTQVFALAAFVPWAVFTVRQYRGLGGVFWVPMPTLYSLVETAYEYVRSTLLQEAFLLLIVLGCLQLTPGPAPGVALRHARQWLEEKNWTVRLAELETTWLLCCWLFIPIAALFFISRVGPSVYVVRATIEAASAFYLMGARGLMQLRGAARMAAVCVIAVILAVELGGYYRAVTKEQWNQMVADVSGLVEPGDLFIFHDPSRQAAFDYYFDGPAVRRIGFPTRRLSATDAITPADLTTLDAASAGYRKVWLVLAHSRDEHHLIENHLLGSRRPGFRRHYAGIDVQAFETVEDTRDER